MKRFFILVFYCLGMIAAEAQSCSPTFKEIFDFEVGDEFYYYTNERYVCGYSACDWVRKEKEKILFKAVADDTLKYIVEHIVGGRWLWRDLAGRYIDTVIYVDSINNVWNKCYTDTVRTFDNLSGSYLYHGGNSYQFFDFSPIVELKEPFDNGYIQFYGKALGSTNYYEPNILSLDTSNGDSSFIQREFGESPIIIGSNGLGLTYEYMSGNFEWLTSKRLVGYVKDSIAVGTIYTDSYLLGTDEKMVDDDVFLYPNPTTGFLRVRFERELKNVMLRVLDLKGALAYTQNFKSLKTNELSINLSFLPKGLYSMHLVSDEIELFDKVILE